MNPNDASRMAVTDDESREPSMIRRLSEAQKQQLTDLLDQYLVSLEQGQPLDLEAMCASHPELAESLRSYVAHLEALHDIAAGFGGPTSDAARVAPESSSLELRRLGDFLLERELGRGGMGVVYEAFQISLGRRVALKVLPFAAVLDSKQIARFKNEAQAAAQVQHPNIVPVFAVGVERGVHYYAMQLIEGQPLDVAIRQLRDEVAGAPATPPATQIRPLALDRALAETVEGAPAARSPHGATDELRLPATDASALTGDLQNAARSSNTTRTRAATTQRYLTGKRRSRADYIQTVVELGIQAAEALHAAHEYGVVHRDIKPSNLLVDHHGKLWVTDFGLARCHSDVSLTRTGDLLGTLRYMSPEQTHGSSAFVDHRTDVYSLGVTLYELLTLKPAFPGDNQVDLLRMIETQPPVPPRQLCPDLPADLENVVLKAIAKSRDERYATALEMADDLRRFSRGLPTVARPPSWLDIASKWARRHRRWMIAGVSSLILTTLALSVTTFVVVRLRADAEAKGRLAEENLRAARRAVEYFGVQLPEELANVPGAELIHRQFLTDALEYYRRFANQDSHNESLREEIALSHSKIGTLEDRAGAHDDALKSHRQALQLFLQLQHDEPNNREHQRHLGLCQNNLGQIFSDRGDYPAADRAFHEALSWQQRLVAHDPDPTYRVDLARTENNLALLQDKQGKADAAIKRLEDAIRAQREVVRERPKNVDDLQQLARFYLNLSGIQQRAQPEVARGWSEAALDVCQQLVDLAPEHPGRLHQLASASNQLGSLLSRAGQFREAVVAFGRAQKILQQLHATAPLERSYWGDLALTWNSLGSAFTQQRDYAKATECFERAITLQTGLAKLASQDAEAQSNLGGMFNNLGVARQESGQFDVALTAFTRAVQAQQVAFDAQPANPHYREFLSNHLYNQADVLRTLKQGAAAAECTRRRRLLWPDDPDRLLGIATELALDRRAIADTPAEAGARQTLLDETLDTLRTAVHQGLRWTDIASLPEPLRSLPGLSTIKPGERDPNGPP